MSLEYLVETKGATLGLGAAAIAENSIAIGATKGDKNGTIPTEHLAAATAKGAVQIGPGTNSDEGTIQFRDTRIPTVILGTGSPGTLTPDFIGQMYVDTNGSAGSILWIGKTTAASGFVNVNA